MRNADESGSEEEEQQHDVQSSDEDEEAAPLNPQGVDEQDDFLPSDGSESDTDNGSVRDSDEEDTIFNDHIETIREYVQPCPSLQTQGWATEFTFRTLDEEDNRIEDIADLVNVVLRNLIRDAKTNALAQGYQGGWIGVGWKSELMEKTFVIPYGHESHNNPRKLLTAFEGFDQSAKENDIYGQIIRVQVTIVNTPPAGNSRRGTKSLVAFGEQKGKADAFLYVMNKDNLCLFKAVVVAIAYDEAPRKSGCKKFMRILRDDADQTMKARDLMARCGIPDDLPEYGVDHLRPVQDYLNAHYTGRYRLLVFSADNGEEDKPIFNGGVNTEKLLILWHEDNHFDAVKTVEKLFKPKKNNLYCPACECFYHGASRHTRYCPIRCSLCLRMGHGYPDRCHTNDVSQHQCYDEHLKAACRVFKMCLQCKHSYRVDDKKRPKHQCGYTRCRTCGQYEAKRHLCYVPVKLPALGTDYRVVVFDIESRITDERTDSGAALHIANVVCARVTCTRCMENGSWEDHDYDQCEICGPSKCVVFTEWTHEGRPMMHFLEWLLRGLSKKWKTYVYSHNGSSYDMQFSLQGLYVRGGRAPKITNNGLKLMQIELRGTKTTCHVVFRDSCLLFPMRLDDIPATFSVSDKVPRKPYFPYKANSIHYYDKEMVGLPPTETYIPSAMSVKKRQHFEDVWYPAESEKRKDVLFDIKKEAVEYCNNDTLELLYGVVHFRKLVNQVASFDVFSCGMTITSLAIRLFKTKFMKENSLAVVPTNGYDRQSRQSTKALKTLKYLAEAHGIDIQHRNSNGGEKAIGAYFVDGFIDAAQLKSLKKCARSRCYCKKSEKRRHEPCRCSLCELCRIDPDNPRIANGIVVEINGCAWHGCNKPGCFVNNVICPNGLTSDENWSRTMKRREDLITIHGMYVYSIQECVIDGWLQRFPEIRDAFGDYFDDGPIDPREAMFGGRVGPMRMHWERKEGSKYRARFFDINSLYPSVLANKAFPVGHPTTVAHDDELCRRVRGGAHWTSPADCPIKGLLKVRVVPPHDLTIPVMPMKDDNRLLFPLCRTCAVQSRKVSPFRPPGCTHDDTQRSFVTTTTHAELIKGLEHHYKVVDLIGYYDWPSDTQWSTELFRSYIYAFVKLKEEASGWKDKGIDVKDPEASDKMVAYREEYMQEQGIQIDIDKVEKNDGLRYVIKLFLNSLWGRFAMRMDRVKAEVVTKRSRFIELLSTKSLQVADITIINEKAARVTYRYRRQFEKEDENSNLVVASFTTAYGRLELFEYMRKVESTMPGGTPHAFGLYGDTDSVCFVEHEDYPAITPGRYLGEMKDEFPGKTIEEVICAGNKQYAIVLRDNVTGEETQKIKCKGFTQNSETCKILTVQNMRRMVKAPPDDPIVLDVPVDIFERDEKANVSTRSTTKRNKIAYRKSWIHEERMYPYGYDPSTAQPLLPLSVDSILAKASDSPPMAKVARYRPVSPTEDPNTPCCSKSLLMD